jgi:hypothetical protein
MAVSTKRIPSAIPEWKDCRPLSIERQSPSDETMSFDFQKGLLSKSARRGELASLPIAEKLRLLEAMRERELAIRASRVSFGHESSQAPRNEGTGS